VIVLDIRMIVSVKAMRMSWGLRHVVIIIAIGHKEVRQGVIIDIDAVYVLLD